MTMNNAIKAIFGPVRAEEDLKDRTRAFLTERTHNYAATPVKRHRYPAYATAFACLLLALFGGRWLYFTPTAAISIDINPSLELSVNRFDRVIGVTGFNEDGQELSGALDVKYKNYAQAVEQILRHDSITALLSDNEIMTITVIGPDGWQSAQILSELKTCTAGQSNIDCDSARPEEASAAHEAGLSCGKYRAFLELRLLDPDITPEAIQGMTMREIRDRIDRLSSGAGSDAPPSGGWGNGHHGNNGGHDGWRQGRSG